MISSNKVAVAQLGARKHYQEPILLHQWNVLDTLYTDFYSGDRIPFNLLRHSRISEHLPAVMKRMIDRYDPALKGAKIVHFPVLGYNYTKSLKQLRGQSTASAHIEAGKSFCRRIIQHGLGDADTVYGFNGACLELFQYAKQQNLRCILDQTLAERYYYYQLMQAEEARWPGWSSYPFTLTNADRELADREQQEQDLADQIICGSEFVKDSLMARGVSAEKIMVVPLGRVKDSAPLIASQLMSGQSQSPWKERPEGLHILFAGSVGLRKGIPYLLEVLLQLKGKVPFVCKAAGSIELRSEVLQPYSEVCQFLGRVPRSEMAALYTWADVFVLPSLCEGSAMVIYEALKFGLQVVTTHNSGSIISNEVGGSIVPIQDSKAIAVSLLNLFEQVTNNDCSTKLGINVEQMQAKAIDNFADAMMVSTPVPVVTNSGKKL
ncbi:glycosyltransferase family 4 protein [Acaryochloris sp. 'Moss Beach']|uniref:glycosyltransferase family 4 protein n=1 Tax=Acaryochloris sp. 'Moss Beach' TaxID=2740837 RepID=UPI001F47A88B|nr:glycosyltransferase family 4 protein [Acaryochloris sp. 'Moss Beach']UJB69821.1 glycosyltransferase family 4 protein [Acaryochloris sp. 'Moss Beach']